MLELSKWQNEMIIYFDSQYVQILLKISMLYGRYGVSRTEKTLELNNP